LWPSEATLVTSTSQLRYRFADQVISVHILIGPVEIPIAPAAPACPTSHGFLPWRLSDDGPGARGAARDGAVIRNPSQNPSPSPAFARLLPPIADIASRGIIMSAQPGDCDRRPRTPAPRLLRPRCAPRARALARHKKPPHAGSPRIAPCCAPKAGGGPGAVASSGGLRRIQRLDLLNMSAPGESRHSGAGQERRI
jgi:hypothetical protein